MKKSTDQKNEKFFHLCFLTTSQMFSEIIKGNVDGLT